MQHQRVMWRGISINMLLPEHRSSWLVCGTRNRKTRKASKQTTQFNTQPPAQSKLSCKGGFYRVESNNQKKKEIVNIEHGSRIPARPRTVMVGPSAPPSASFVETLPVCVIGTRSPLGPRIVVRRVTLHDRYEWRPAIWSRRHNPMWHLT